MELDERIERNMDWKKNDVFQVQIEDMSDTGEGIGKTDGFTWFVKDAAKDGKVCSEFSRRKLI